MGVIKLLTEGPAMLNDNYVKWWAPLLTALIHMFEESADTSVPAVSSLTTCYQLCSKFVMRGTEGRKMQLLYMVSL